MEPYSPAEFLKNSLFRNSNLLVPANETIPAVVVALLF